MSSPETAIPPFRADGYLPEGLYRALEAEVTFRFGAGSRQRRRLALRLRHWTGLCRRVGGKRLLVDGSFVTAKDQPDDLDVVFLIPAGFQQQVEKGDDAAVELERLLLTRHPEEMFAAEDEADWEDWVEFFSRTRESSARRKGLVEVVL